LTLPPSNGSYRGPSVVIITTTVDQATQCHKRKRFGLRAQFEELTSVVRSVGGPLGVRAALAAGVAGSSSLSGEIAQMQRDSVQLLIGTPAKIAEVLSPRGMNGSEVKLLIVCRQSQMTSTLLTYSWMKSTS
jgi:translation initiation factor 4A